MLKPSTLGLALVLSTFSAVNAKPQRATLRDERLFACQDDIKRFCDGSLPDKQELESCLRPQKALVSAKCRAWLNAPE